MSKHMKRSLDERQEGLQTANAGFTGKQTIFKPLKELYPPEEKGSLQKHAGKSSKTPDFVDFKTFISRPNIRQQPLSQLQFCQPASPPKQSGAADIREAKGCFYDNLVAQNDKEDEFRVTRCCGQVSVINAGENVEDSSDDEIDDVYLLSESHNTSTGIIFPTESDSSPPAKRGSYEQPKKNQCCTIDKDTVKIGTNAKALKEKVYSKSVIFD